MGDGKYSDATGAGHTPPRVASLPRRRASRKGGIPLYYQIMRDLKEQIVSGKLGPGDRLPSEAEFTRRFQVSRVVIRQALRILDEQALIVRVKGKGTFVSDAVREDAAPRISGSLEDLIHIGADTTIKVVEFRLAKATPDLAEVFGVKEGDDLFHVQRIRLVGGRPLAVLVNHVPYGIGATIPLSDLTKEPLIVLIEKRAGVHIEWASQMFQAVAADEYMARLLEVDILTPLLKLTLTAYSTDGTVVDLAHAFYRSDRYYHHGFLTRNRKDGPTFWSAWDSNRSAPSASAAATRAV
ncbi:MAG: GntR family transcriptional regulator [Actinobacteria bacterium]|jgi:GntR family transcriptional regulator|nr:GntR family transcriptional regulator [Actinomycetota bacterium]